MHRHAYSTKKLSRTTGPRRAVLRGLLDSLILYERIETTETKAKILAPYFERQVTYAKKQNLASYRQIMSNTINPLAAQKLNYDLVNGFKKRNGGYTRIIKTGIRLGDGAPMAIIELILDEDYVKKQTSQDSTKTKSDNNVNTKAKKVKKEEVKTKITGVKAKKKETKK